MHGMSGEYCNNIPEATIYRYIGGQTSYNISLYWRQVGILYQLLAISGKQFFFWNSLLRQKKIFFGFSILVFYPISNFSNINPEVWRFGKPTKLEIEMGKSVAWMHKPKVDLARYERHQRRNLDKKLSWKGCWISVPAKLRRNSSIFTRFFPLYKLFQNRQLLHRQGE